MVTTGLLQLPAVSDETAVLLNKADVRNCPRTTSRFTSQQFW